MESGTWKDIDSNLLKAIEDKDHFANELNKAQKKLNDMEDLKLMLDGTKLHIWDGEVKIARLIEILRELKIDNTEIPKNQTIDYHRALSKSGRIVLQWKPLLP